MSEMRIPQKPKKNVGLKGVTASIPIEHWRLLQREAARRKVSMTSLINEMLLKGGLSKLIANGVDLSVKDED